MASPVNISPIFVLNREDIFMDAISSETSRLNPLENGSEEYVSDSQENMAIRKRLYSEISPDRDNFPPESGFLQVVVNQSLSPYKERPDFNFETADAHYSFSRDLSEDEDEYYTPYRELEIDSSQAAFRMSLNSSDTIETLSSLGSNSVEINEDAQSKTNIDQFDSFLESDIIEGVESNSYPMLEGMNQNKKPVVDASEKDAEKNQNGIQVNLHP
ncbi:hypothetical protein MKW92_045365 [Papaver armeniacum]|nr:hypothetical protein MKW92_045365 [Papaver armeniacum]